MKKSFCDGWDNLLGVFLVNVICSFSFIGLFMLFLTFIKAEAILFAGLTFVLATIILSILVFAYGDSAAEIANFNSVRFVDFFKAIPHALLDGLRFGLLVSGITIISYIGISYYWSVDFLQKYREIGIFLGALLMWMDVFVLLSLQWFLPIRSLMKNNFAKCLKKSFIIFFDNTGFSILMFFHNFVLLVISVFPFVGMMPAWAGILIAQTNALRLRLYKYDYLEEHPELQGKRQRNKIPWEELIYDDRETLGPRKFKSFLFPWKED